MDVRIGQLLVERDLIDAASVQRVLALQEGSADRFGAICVRLGLLSEHNLLRVLSEQLDCPLFDMSASESVLAAACQFHEKLGISASLASRLQFFAWLEDEVLCIAGRDVLDSSLRELVATRWGAGRTCRWLLVATRDYERLHTSIYRPSTGALLGQDQDLRRLAEDAPVVELVNGLLARANDYATSDVHIEPHEFGFAVRYRIDGRLQAPEQYPRERFDAVASRIKLISGLDIAERRLPQDGRFSSRAAGLDVDVRVSVIPGVHGESLVLRLLPATQNKRFVLDSLGFEADHLKMFKEWMSQPDGIILVTGPTGSGKSTTLYSALAACATETERILTVEDPVEYQVPGVTQFQVHADIGFTFPAALRAILRHDPDTIMIGEIRDTETARIAVQASLTGHRVLSTLHTNDSLTAFLRLADMGVEPFLVGATVRGVVAQRLIRRLCDCAVSASSGDTVPPSVIKALEAQGVEKSQFAFRTATGCERCYGTGYRGRMAIYELLPATEPLRAVLGRTDSSHLDLLQVIPEGFRYLRDDGLLKASRGITSLEEVFLTTGNMPE